MTGLISHGEVPPAKSAVPEDSIIALMLRGCREDPFRPLVIVEDGPRFTRKAFEDRVAAFAGYLADKVKPHDRVVVMLDNRLEYLVAFFAILACRGTLVSISPDAKAHDAGHILRDAKPVLVIAGAAQAEVLKGVEGPVPEVLVVGEPEPDGLVPYDAAPLDLGKVAGEREDIAAIYYTSGSTGAPKGCMLHNGWWLNVVDTDLRLFPRGWQDRQLCCLPFYYADPTIQLLTSLASRGTMIAMRRFSVSRFWDVVRTHDATEILSIASIPALLLTGERSEAERDHRIRLAIHAGLPPDIHAELLERYGFDWLNQYGQTEGGLISRVPMEGSERFTGTGTMGVEPPGVQVKVLNEAGEEVPVGEAGEAAVFSEDVFRGYLGRPEATAETIRDGWVHTGDLVRRDAQGLLYFVGRKKEIVRRSGENISGAEVEAVLSSHPRIVEAAVIPVPDKLRGEEVKAILSVKGGGGREALPPDEVLAWCRERLAGFKVPRYLAWQEGEFPRLPSMKIDRQALRRAHDFDDPGLWDREAGK
ncbi:class I adenylate-forming enzyme family protein [Roseovarius indicus]|uniref:class I adenylate-forming enzyme family protein n=1 Tax=Roseovarius indicus TaxID=540747 RepID=UPI0032F060D5